MVHNMCYKYADYVIKKINEENKYKPFEKRVILSNKRLQKILFIASVEYARLHNGEKMFAEDFYAWTYGPVMPEVYSSYSIFQHGQMMPLSKEWQEITPEKKAILDEVVKRTETFTTNQLIENTHKRGTPWNNAFSLSENKTQIISSNDIYEYYKNEKNFNELYSKNDEN